MAVIALLRLWPLLPCTFAQIAPFVLSLYCYLPLFSTFLACPPFALSIYCHFPLFPLFLCITSVPLFYAKLIHFHTLISFTSVIVYKKPFDCDILVCNISPILRIVFQVCFNLLIMKIAGFYDLFPFRRNQRGQNIKKDFGSYFRFHFAIE